MGKYQIMKNEDFRPLIGCEYGKVIDIMGRQVISAIYDPKAFDKYGFHLSICVEPNLLFCPVFFDDLYLKYFEEDPLYFAVTIMHELGHYVNEDYVEMDGTTGKKNRIKGLKNGAVDQAELNADRFAADNLGVGLVLKKLKKMKDHRRERGDIGAPIAIREIELRIQALEDYRSKYKSIKTR